MININTELARNLIDDQFPNWSSLTISLVEPGGWDNRTFRLGCEFTVRMPSAETYVAQVYKEQQWLPFLANNLSTKIPKVQALGKPGYGYPWPWSVYKWIKGGTASQTSDIEKNTFAKELASFILELHSVNSTKGPKPGKHNYFRGGRLEIYDSDTKKYATGLSEDVDLPAVLRLWNRAKSTQWPGEPVWIHGDLEASNILVSNGKMRAIIDFGNCAVGDPACDLVMAWTYFDTASRYSFRSALGIDEDTWERGKAWALWKALFRMSQSQHSRNDEFYAAKRIVETVLSD